MASGDPDRAASYMDKAAQFLRAMNHLQSKADEAFSYSTAITVLAVHSAISLNDAIFTAIEGKSPKYEDHEKAAAALSRLCDSRHVKDKSGIKEFRKLLRKKTEAAYSHKLVDRTNANSSVVSATSFQDWAYTVFKEVLRAP